MGFFIRATLCALLFTIGIKSNAQTALIDSLVRQIAITPDDTMKVRMVNNLAFRFYRIKPDTTVSLATMALELARKLEYPKGEGIALQRIGLGNNALGNFNEAIDFYDQSIRVFRNIGDSSGVSGTLMNLGSSHYGQGRFDASIEAFRQAFVIAEAAGNRRRMASLLNNMGVISLANSNYPKALDLYQQALVIKEELGDPGSISSTLGNMGSIYLNLKDYDKAKDHYERSLALKIEASDKSGEAIMRNNLGLLGVETGDLELALYHYRLSNAINEALGQKCAATYPLSGLADTHLAMEQYDSALYYGKAALAFVRECEDKEQLSVTQGILGAVYRMTGNYQASERALLESIANAEELSYDQQLKKSTEQLYLLYKERGQYSKALAYHEKFKAATDTIFNESNTEQITQLEAQYDFDQERKALEAEQEKTQILFDAELKRQAIIRNGIIVGTVLLLLLAINFYRSFKLKQKANGLLAAKNQQLTELGEFKENLTHMIVHDMKNPLNAVIGLSKGEATAKKLQTINQSGNQMLTMVTNMLDVQKFEETKVSLDTAPHLVDHLLDEASVHLELVMHAKGIVLDRSIPAGLHVDVDGELIVRVLGNLLSNALKFSEHKGKIEVSSTTPDANGLVTLSITDYGQGIPEEQVAQVFDKYWQGARQSGYNSSTGLGLTFCKLAVEAHGGTIKVASVTGEYTRFSFSLPGTVEAVTATETAEPMEREESLILESDIAVLSKYISELDQLKVHQVGKINSIIRELDKEDVQSPWKKNLVNAMHQGNQDRFDELVEMLK